MGALFSKKYTKLKENQKEIPTLIIVNQKYPNKVGDINFDWWPISIYSDDKIQEASNNVNWTLYFENNKCNIDYKYYYFSPK